MGKDLKDLIAAGFVAAVLLLSAGARAQADGGFGSDGGTPTDGGQPAPGVLTGVALAALPVFTNIPVLDIDAVIADDGSIVSTGSVALLVEGLPATGDAGTGGGGAPDSGGTSNDGGAANPDGGNGGSADGGSGGGGSGSAFAARFLGLVTLSGDGGVVLADGGSIALGSGGVFGFSNGGTAPPCGSDGGSVSDGGCFSPAGLSFSLWGTTVQLPGGTSRITALAFDKSGNQTASPSAMVVVAGLPQVGFVAPLEGALVFNLQDVTAAAQGQGADIAKLTLSAAGASFTCAPSAPSPKLSCTWANVDVLALCPPGRGCALQLTATATDSFGQTASAQRTVTVDRRFGIRHPHQGERVHDLLQLNLRPPPGSNQAQCTVGGLPVELHLTPRGHLRGTVSTKPLSDGLQPIDCAFAAGDGPATSARVQVLVQNRGRKP